MNISKIQKMSSEGDISIQALRYLLNCRGECEHLDYKKTIDFNLEHDCVCITKDIIGMKNIGGGYIIIGVEDKTWKPTGLKASLNIDTKQLRDKVRKYSGLDIETYIVEHSIYCNGYDETFALILIRASLKLSKLKSPSICKISHIEKERWGIRQGDIYIRDGDQTIRLDDINKLFERLEDLSDKYQEAEQYEASISPSPFEVEAGLYRLLPREYENFVGRKQLLEKIKTAIEKDPRIWIINLYGPGGVGKSALATCVAYDYYREKRYEAILHLSAKDRELNAGLGIRSLRPSLISIEDFLDRILHLFSHEEYCKEDLQIKKKTVNELLSAWNTLLILDNMETVSDGRIMDFVREFPPSIKAKVLLTSRQRTSEWEMPVQVPELSEEEIGEFIKLRSKELNLNFPYKDSNLITKIAQISGGLPLAIQWILGDYARNNDIETILKRVLSPESPLLEFSFRNSWKTLEFDAQRALAILPIFNSPPTLQEWRTVLNWTIDRTEKAKTNLVESTFVTQRTDQNTGSKIYLALPITLSFAKNELLKMGDWGVLAKSRYEMYKQKMSLDQEEADRYEGLFTQFEAKTDNQKKAILLARMAEGEVTTLGFQEAEEYYKQALSVDPFSIYALVSYAKFKADLLEYDYAIQLIERGLQRVTKATGFYIYFNLADIYGRKKDWVMKVKYLNEALNYDKNSETMQFTIAKHSLGVGLGKLKKHSEAIKIYDDIIFHELQRQSGPTQSLIVAARTKKFSLIRTDPELCIPFLDDLIIKCEAIPNTEYMIEQLKAIRDVE
jgi:tetratricopeptide (TPR) repeat protein